MSLLNLPNLLENQNHIRTGEQIEWFGWIEQVNIEDLFNHYSSSTESTDETHLFPTLHAYNIITSHIKY